MSSLLQFFTTLEMFQEYYGSKGKYLQARPIEFDTVKIVKIEEVRQMWTITTNGNITGSDTWCGFQLPLYFHLFFDICSVGFLISEVIVVCGCCCGHYLFDTLNTDRTRAGADPITSSFFQITFFQVRDTTQGKVQRKKRKTNRCQFFPYTFLPQLQKVFLSPGTCFLRRNFPNIEEEFS